MPNCPAIEVPRFDEEVRKQLRSKDRDMCTDIINPDIEPDKEKGCTPGAKGPSFVGQGFPLYYPRKTENCVGQN